MYTIILNQGIVIRDSDNVIVSPADSTSNPLFVAYQEWINQGNQPTILETIGE